MGTTKKNVEVKEKEVSPLVLWAGTIFSIFGIVINGITAAQRYDQPLVGFIVSLILTAILIGFVVSGKEIKTIWEKSPWILVYGVALIVNAALFQVFFMN